MQRLVVMFAFVVACGDAAGDTADGASDSQGAPCTPPVYAGEATDDAWRSIIDAYDLATAGPNAVVVTTPGDGQIFASTAKPTFAWTSPIAGGALMPHIEPLPGAERSWIASAWAALAEFFEGTAYAHLPPITGDIYYLEIAVPGQSCPLTALTTDLTWTPDGVTWAKLAATGGATLRLTITSAYLNENRITEGPYRTARATEFSVR